MSVETRIIKSAVRKDHTREARAAAAFPVAVDIRVPNLDRWRIVLKDRKGGDMSEWAEDLRVRQFPEAR